MKGYTDINQSKLLAEILPIESGDMRYTPFDYDHPWVWDGKLIEADSIPCWSLTALLAQMPCVELISSQDNKYRVFWKDRFSEWHTNAVDACVELLERVRKEKEK